MNKINQSNEHSRLASPFVSEEVKNVIKNTTKQANAINNISNYVTTQQQKENQSKFDIPLLRAPHEQERNEKRINIQDDPQYKMTTFSLENDEGHCCKVSDEAAFCLIQRPYVSKTLLTRRISPRGSP